MTWISVVHYGAKVGSPVYRPVDRVSLERRRTDETRDDMHRAAHLPLPAR